MNIYKYKVVRDLGYNNKYEKYVIGVGLEEDSIRNTLLIIMPL